MRLNHYKKLYLSETSDAYAMITEKWDISGGQKGRIIVWNYEEWFSDLGGLGNASGKDSKHDR